MIENALNEEETVLEEPLIETCGREQNVFLYSLFAMMVTFHYHEGQLCMLDLMFSLSLHNDITKQYSIATLKHSHSSCRLLMYSVNVLMQKRVGL